MHRAPLLAPAIAALLAIIADQHGFTTVALACAIAIAGASLMPIRWCSSALVRAIAAGVLFGLAASVWRGHPPVIVSEHATQRYQATVVGDVIERDAGARSTVFAIDGVGAVRATVHERIAPGDRLMVRGRLEPFDEPRNPGEPSMREIERDDGYLGRLAAVRILERSPADAHDRRAWAARLRGAASARLRRCVPEPEATILAGALWGERGALPDDVRDAFQATGTVHVLVTAGLHLGIVAALVAFILARFRMHRISACIIAFFVVVAYAWFSGAHLPSERAAAMIGAALIARACGARIASLNALALAALVVAALWPAAVESASFALSFSCLAAIVLFAKPIGGLLEAFPLHERIREALALTIATQLGTWPLTAAIFSTLAPFAILANAVVVPMMAVIIPGGLLTLAIPAFAPCETLFVHSIQTIVQTIGSIPGARASIAAPLPALLLVYDVLALASALAFTHHCKRLGIAALCTAFSVVVIPSIVRLPHGLEIVHLDVGQADASVIRTPNGHIVLIDAGGELERGSGPISNAERAGARIVLAYLRRSGIGKIDLMILTHPHGDHVGGCSPIIEAMPVAMVFDSAQQYGGRSYRDCIASAKAHAIPIEIARRGMRWESDDGVALDILAPSMPFLADTGDDVNENSIVVMLHYRRFGELFMGDAGEASEERLLNAGDDLHADIVKVGHHGSAYASTSLFASHVKAAYAVISVGRHNTFGHPASMTIETWHHNGARVLQTDTCGAVTIDPDTRPHSTISCDARMTPPQLAHRSLLLSQLGALPLIDESPSRLGRDQQVQYFMPRPVPASRQIVVLPRGSLMSSRKPITQAVTALSIASHEDRLPSRLKKRTADRRKPSRAARGRNTSGSEWLCAERSPARSARHRSRRSGS